MTFLKNFSRPGNRYILYIPNLFQVFHDHTNPFHLSAVSPDGRKFGECAVVYMNFPSNSDDVTKRTSCLCQCCVLVFESVVNKHANLSLYLGCWATWTCDSCRWFAAHRTQHWWWWLSPGNTSTDMQFFFKSHLIPPGRFISCKNKTAEWSKVHLSVLI